MFSTIPKLADRAFIVGYLLPVAAFLTTVLFLLSDIPFFAKINDLLQSDKNFEKIVYLGLLLWGLSIVLMVINHNIYQLIEGHIWPIPQLAKKFGSKEVRRFKAFSQELEKLGQSWGESEETDQKYDTLLTKLKTQFPSNEKFVLPTRFGNVIAAFEDYPTEVYGADPIPLWLHLNTVMSKEFQSAVEDARASVTCTMNTFFLSLLLTALSFFRIIVCVAEDWFGHQIETVEKLWSFGAFALAGGLVTWLAYELSVQKAYGWGAFVKAAFDCYLPALAKKLGYKLPVRGEDQKEFWRAVTRRAAFHRELKPEDWPGLDCSKSKCIASQGADDAETEENSDEEEVPEDDEDEGREE